MEREGRRLSPGVGGRGGDAGAAAVLCQGRARGREVSARGPTRWGPDAGIKAWAADGSHKERTDDSFIYVWSRPGEVHE